MKMNGISRISIIRKTIVINLFLWFIITCVLSQDNKPSFTDSKYENEWWFSLIKKHNIDPNKFTFWGNIKPASSDPKGYTALELGEGSFIKDNILIIRNPVFLIKENEEEYNIVSAISASHKLRGLSEIEWDNGKIESFKFKTLKVDPTRSLLFDTLTMDTKTKRSTIKSVSGTVKN
jgi:hypothetical protein